jgi:hypothetical protein
MRPDTVVGLMKNSELSEHCGAIIEFFAATVRKRNTRRA